MADNLSPERRSENMRRIKAANTLPEMIVRHVAHSLGYRYRLHQKSLPGKPDLVFAGRRVVIFVHGCFWHGHNCKRGARVPKANRAYWLAKVGRNRERDILHEKRLNVLGWRVLTIWECELRDSKLPSRIKRLLG
jgi:DNA mismatch endonuclease (patch repair protein)